MRSDRGRGEGKKLFFFLDFLLKYIKGLRVFFFVFLLFVFFFALTFYLYHLPLEAVLYPTLVCLVFLLIIVVVRCFGAFKRHLFLWSAANFLPEIPESLSCDGVFEEDFLNLLKKLSEAFKKLSNEKDFRYANMQDYYSLWVHQIKTPIASMKLTLQNGNSPAATRLLSDLRRIELYVEMVLTYIRLESETSDYLIKEFDLDGIIKATLRNFASDFINKHLKLDYQESGVKILTDEKWFSFVLGQVLSNALKYTPEGSVSIYLEGDETLCIRDTGIGINPEDLPRVFECSYTGGNGRGMGAGSVGGASSGIGLYLCRRICRNLNHTIEIDSRPDEGTTVRIGIGRNKERLE
ncbi:MAG: HAMP domain-containing histidine kinase [Treponemataceae bacterium]|nr:HAMP domain-containing histidine kinase [Treponemataceae bacterium]